jgi:hypothetical protein
VRAYGRFEHDTGTECVPRAGAPVGEENLPDPSRRKFAALVANDSDAHDGHVEVVAVPPGHTPDGPLGHAALADDAVDARHDLGAVRQRDGASIDVLLVAQAQVHLAREYFG